jgi:hypothetical protein
MGMAQDVAVASLPALAFADTSWLESASELIADSGMYNLISASN